MTHKNKRNEKDFEDILYDKNDISIDTEFFESDLISIDQVLPTKLFIGTIDVAISAPVNSCLASAIEGWCNVNAALYVTLNFLK